MSSNHPFELSGLGLAPFHAIGCTHEVGPKSLGNGVTVGAPGQPMGTCDHCGQGIADVWRVRSADGREFNVGSDCVLKAEKDYGAKRSELKKAVTRRRREMQKGREEVRITAARQLIFSPSLFAADLAQIPGFQRPTESVLDGAQWMMVNSGHSGRMRITRAIEKWQKELPA